MSKQIAVLNESGLPTCEFTKFTNLQGNFKELSKKNYEKLRESIITYGFTFPIFVWQDDSTLYTMDGTQRLRVLPKLKDDGYFIPEIPYCKIYAKDKRDAVERLLMFNSRFGHISEEGLYELTSINEIDIESFMPKVDFPEIKEKQFVDSYKREFPGVGDRDELDGKTYITCPKCTHKWERGIGE